MQAIPPSEVPLPPQLVRNAPQAGSSHLPPASLERPVVTSIPVPSRQRTVQEPSDSPVARVSSPAPRMPQVTVKTPVALVPQLSAPTAVFSRQIPVQVEIPIPVEVLRPAILAPKPNLSLEPADTVPSQEQPSTPPSLERRPSKEKRKPALDTNLGSKNRGRQGRRGVSPQGKSRSPSREKASSPQRRGSKSPMR